MGLIKCPRCELNYMKETEKFCDVCKKEMKGEEDSDESLDICPECNEHPVVPGEELCLVCLREKLRQEGNEEEEELDEDGEEIDEDDDLDVVNEEMLDDDDDIPATEKVEINKEFGDNEEMEEGFLAEEENKEPDKNVKTTKKSKKRSTR